MKREVKYPKLLEGRYKHYDYLVMSNGHGFRCGYVVIPKYNPFYGRKYNSKLRKLPKEEGMYQRPETLLEAHGGITFAGFTDLEGYEGKFLIGFDCAHGYDGIDVELIDEPKVRKYIESRIDRPWYRVIKTTEYVESECKYLIRRIIFHSRLLKKAGY